MCGRNFKRRIHNGGAEIVWTCAAHIEDAKKCSIKYVRDDVLKVAFVTMLNKLIFSRKLILKPLLSSLKSDSSDENVHRMQQLQKLLETNTEKRNTLRMLRSQEIIDTVMYNREMNLLKKQAEDYRNEISRLSQYTTGEAAPVLQNWNICFDLLKVRHLFRNLVMLCSLRLLTTLSFMIGTVSDSN